MRLQKKKNNCLQKSFLKFPTRQAFGDHYWNMLFGTESQFKKWKMQMYSEMPTIETLKENDNKVGKQSFRPLQIFRY